MLTKKELEIIELFRKNILEDFSIREIMKRINTKSYNWTFNAVKKLQKENILSLTKKGQNQLCRINLDSQKTISYISLLEELNTLNQKIPNLSKIISLININLYILIIAGSYAENKQTKNSDLDIVVIIDKENEKKWILNKLNNEGDLMIPKLHPYVFTSDEFLEMLKNKEFNYGKEISRKHLVVSGAEYYFKILREAIKNGFNG